MTDWKALRINIPWLLYNPEADIMAMPVRQFVWVEGHRRHSGMDIKWARSYMGIAGLDRNGRQHYVTSHIEAIEEQGDMDLGSGVVTHWAPCSCNAPTDPVWMWT